MRKNTFSTICLSTLVSALLSGSCSCAQTVSPTVFNGMSDASAGAFLSDERFVVADDENNILKIYNLSDPSRPAALHDLSAFLRTTFDSPEADIEGAARVGDRIYWITSHGRNKDGKERPNRYRFFATDIRNTAGGITIAPAGRPCQEMVPALLQASFARDLGLDDATQLGKDLKKKQRERLAPKEEGLNIEALAASPDGQTLYIGLRNPRPDHPLTGRPQAIIIPLTNPRDVIDKAARPRFGEPILWDLGGHGLRSMDYSPAHKAFFLIAGPHNEGSGCTLYRWSGDRDQAPTPLQTFTKDGFTPEALIPTADGRLFLLSDDGSRLVKIAHPAECIPGELVDANTCQNKHLVDPLKRTFHAVFVKP
ncbi:MAG TPA: DUF3616 domain-containing protein [Anaerohalosphaeraceae bacterium]|jgi:hypothetical protein|nr:DUF3616 domain-containing protein [Anaerohalosphaeraceae bacterium]HRT49652.1 DUF3616 domain-containing protein [Anaerohalosphaeraceae bacterium]HRT85969.1 DUF3616 domain-containing protein [Anaerohalosphaeraceae bacterium]